MPKLTFFPLGNADCCRIDLANGKMILFDYAATRCADEKNDKRVDLSKVLRDDLDAAKRNAYDVVAFTHLDNDHICGATEFFYLEHAKKYQSDTRVRIAELWVPAAAIIDGDCDDEAAVIRAEARHRLKNGKGIRVFSRPAALEQWLAGEGIRIADRAALITDAGQLVSGLTLAADGVELFVHSPFASRLEDGTMLDRNIDSLFMQATFSVNDVLTKLILGSDVDHCALTDIVNITRYHKRDVRLEWDVFKLPHHCSYLSLAPDKGKDTTEPVPNVKWLFETQAQARATVVSTSCPIPTTDTDQPPHVQAANYQRQIRNTRNGEFLVTMEHPTVSNPEPLVIEIDQFKATLKKRAVAAGVTVVSGSAPRAGARTEG
jgi:hypothetical protein